MLDKMLPDVYGAIVETLGGKEVNDNRDSIQVKPDNLFKKELYLDLKGPISKISLPDLDENCFAIKFRTNLTKRKGFFLIYKKAEDWFIKKFIYSNNANDNINFPTLFDSCEYKFSGSFDSKCPGYDEPIRKCFETKIDKTILMQLSRFIRNEKLLWQILDNIVINNYWGDDCFPESENLTTNDPLIRDVQIDLHH